MRIAAAALLALALAGAARADVGLHPVTKLVPAGGVLAGRGDGAGLAVYLVPARLGPRRRACGARAVCEPTVRRPPGPPFVLLGRLRRTRDPYAEQRFAFRLARRTRPGLYRLYLYCPACGGSLIQSGARLAGETIRVTARPRPRTVRLAAGPARRRFLVSEPAGVALLVRLTVPHGADVAAAATIPGVAGVGVSTRTASCRRDGAFDVCTQQQEWCPLPAAAWELRLVKASGPAGPVRLDLVVGPPPR